MDELVTPLDRHVLHVERPRLHKPWITRVKKRIRRPRREADHGRNEFTNNQYKLPTGCELKDMMHEMRKYVIVVFYDFSWSVWKPPHCTFNIYKKWNLLQVWSISLDGSNSGLSLLSSF